MNDRIEHVTNVTKASEVVVSAMEGYLQNSLEQGNETAEALGCNDCSTLALCGLAMNVLRRKRLATAGTVETLRRHGISASEDGEMCPRELVQGAIERNEKNDFWLLKADELNESSLDLQAAQTVQFAAQHIAGLIDRKIVL